MGKAPDVARLSRWSRLSLHVRDDGSNKLELLVHQAAEIVLIEVALSLVPLGASEDRRAGEDALVRQPGSKLDEGVSGIQVELAARA